MQGIDNRKKVLWVVRWPVGGIRTFMRYVYRDWDPREWSFTLVAPSGDELKVLLNEDLANLKIRHIPVSPNPSIQEFSGTVARHVVAGHYDLVHSHGFTSGLSTAMPARLRGATHLMTSHDVINPSQFEGARGRIKKAFIAGLFRSLDEIHSVSRDAQDNLLEYFPEVETGRCHVIPNGIEVERFQGTEPRDLRGELELTGDDFLIGFMGRFMAQKGFRYLIDAVEILSCRNDLPRRPRILTFGWGGFIREDQEEVRRRGLEGYFHYLPFTANVAGSIKGLDVVAMPSLWEACGLLGMEVLACGIPLIASNCIGLREFVTDTPATLVPLRDGQALADAIVRHMSEDLSPAFQEFAPEARRLFDVRKQVSGIQERYRALCE